MLDFSQDIPLSPSEQNISLIILGILVVAVLLGVVLAWIIHEISSQKRKDALKS